MIRSKIVIKTTILQNISWQFLQDIPAQILGIIFFMVLGQRLGSIGLGSYSYVMSVMLMLGIIVDFGLTNTFWRRWSSQPEKIKHESGQYLFSKVITLSIASVFFLLYILLLDYGVWSYFLIAFIYLALDIPRSLPVLVFQSTNQFRNLFITNFIDKTISFTVAIVLIFLGAGLHTVFLSLVFTRIVSVIFGYYLLKFLPRINFKPIEARGILQSNWMMFLIAFFGVFYFKLDVILIRRMINYEAVGLYSSAYRIIDSLNLVPNIIMFAIFPSLALLTHQQDVDKSSQLINKTIQYLLIFSIYITLFIYFYTQEILSFLYSNLFVEAANTLQILSFSIVLIFLSVPLVYINLAQNNDKRLLTRLMILTVINIILNIFLLPIFGIKGAAFATVITEFLGLIILLKEIRLSIPIDWFIKFTIIVLISIITFNFIHPQLISMGIFFTLFYAFLCFALRVSELEDFPQIQSGLKFFLKVKEL